jgi:hypothetical protein
MNRKASASFVADTSAATKGARVTKAETNRQRLLLGLLGLGGLTGSLAIIKIAPAPFFWIGITWGAILFAAVFVVRRTSVRAVLWNLGIVACALAIFEGYVITHEYTPPTFPNGLYVRDDALGWAPQKGFAARAIKAGPAGLFHGPQGTLFDTTYTIDSNGLRVSPPWRKDDLAGSVLFFGCSFTFGEGLKDEETLPYQVGVQSGGEYRIFNFGFEGYSPSQMLAAIEHGIVGRLVDNPPRYAFYVALPVHVWRTAGRVAWGGHAPHYVLASDGTVHEVGFFDVDKRFQSVLGTQIAPWLNKSAIWRLIMGHDSPITDDDIRLYFAVVHRSQELLAKQYPGIQFHVILWPNQTVQPTSTYKKLRDGFRQMGFSLHLVEDILPGYTADRSKFILSSADHHPNALADRLIAQYIVRDILPQQQK